MLMRYHWGLGPGHCGTTGTSAMAWSASISSPYQELEGDIVQHQDPLEDTMVYGTHPYWPDNQGAAGNDDDDDDDAQPANSESNVMDSEHPADFEDELFTEIKSFKAKADL